MKRAAIALSLAVLLPAPAFAEEAVQFDFTISRGDHVVGSSSTPAAEASH